MLNYVKQMKQKMKQRHIERMNFEAVRHLDPKIRKDIGVSIDPSLRTAHRWF